MNEETNYYGPLGGAEAGAFRGASRGVGEQFSHACSLV